MTFRVSSRAFVRIVAVVGICAGGFFVAAPSQAHHSIEMTDCSADRSPDPEPDLTPPPTEPPDGEEGPPPEPEPTPPPQNCIPKSGERIWGTRYLHFEVMASNVRPIRQVTLSILSQEKSIASPNNGNPVFTQNYEDSGSAPAEEGYTFAWNSVELTPRNGRYKIHIEATTHNPHPENGSVQTADRLDLRVDNPPQAIAPPRILSVATNSITLEWNRAPEPDLRSYTVYKATTSKAKTRPAYSAFKPILVTQANAHRDDDAIRPGAHWYTVRVTRRSIVTPDAGISSPMSAMSRGAVIEPPKPKPDGNTAPVMRHIPRLLPRLTVPSVGGRLPPPPDAPFSTRLPYDVEPGEPVEPGIEEEVPEPGGAGDPRGPVLPVAVGAFLVSSALALGRMPY